MNERQRIILNRLLIATADVLGDGAGSELAAANAAAGPVGTAAKKAHFNRAASGVAGTGKPIPQLNGVARDSAARAAAGGGPKYAGGRGIEGGNKALNATQWKGELAALGIYVTLSTALRIGRRYRQLLREEQTAELVVGHREEPTDIASD